ncbi:hypothetical protein LOC68_25840 [Blastopirellula sp. JC732]|uniref:Uncharacterized protein n=1 Tax=Blastopirellula sediminis TaxID=2894196 RepID=A0A9X1MSR9_9BACT|nr:hypothetical protein [Blastopirellula sediminis]MCC9604869.1 hypothetical protein [Blastopirellula sediminis]MCC9631832.1 hypothetical protein [Blastopirellula sediminis]
MYSFSVEDLRLLVDNDAQPCVSLFMPAHVAGKDTHQDPIQLATLLKKACARLKAAGHPAEVIQKMLEPAWGITRNREADDWRHMDEGFAYFASPTMHRAIRLPFHVEPAVHLADRFHIRPLTCWMCQPLDFALLVISQNEIRFFEGDQYEMRHVDVADLPSDLRSALQVDEWTDTLRFHGHGPRAGETIFHGQVAGSAADLKSELTRFFQRVARPLESHLANCDKPLIFAGVDYLFPMFRDAFRSDALWEEHLSGNFDHATPQQLHEQVTPLLTERASQVRRSAVEQMSRLRGVSRASVDAKETLIAAMMDGVDVLFLTRGAKAHGIVDEENERIVLTRTEGDEDLLNYAAVRTLSSGGSVYTLEADDMPDGAQVAATFRFPIPDAIYDTDLFIKSTP